MSEPPFPGGGIAKAEETPADPGSGLLLIVLVCFVVGFFLGLAVALIVYWNLGQENAAQQARIAELEQRLRDVKKSAQAQPKPADKAEPKAEVPAAESPSKKPAEKQSPQPETPPVPVTARLARKQFQRLDLGAGEEDAILLSLVLTNQGARDIESFRGFIKFTDLLGQPIMTAGFGFGEGLEAGRTKSWSGAILYDKNMSDHRRLLAAEPGKIRAELVVEEVVYSGGEEERLDR